MTAGVPGTGIGGLFYILSAILLPVRALWIRLRGGPPSVRPVLKLTVIALGVLGGIWATGWLLGLLLEPTIVIARQASAAVASVRLKYENFVRWAALLAGFATLGGVLLIVQMARLIVRPKKRSP